MSAITVVELWFGIGVETNAARAKRRRRWLEKLLHRMEVVPLDQAIARVQARIWAQLAEAGQVIGHYDLTVAATAIYRDWEVPIQCWKGMACRIEVSPDLTAWTPLATVTNLTGILQWTDPDAPGRSAHFYRAVKQ